MIHNLNRRAFVRQMCLGGIATFGLPLVSFAQVKQPGRFVFVLLRGGFDGLAAVVPYGDERITRCAADLPLKSRNCFRSATCSAWRRASHRCASCGRPTRW